MEHCARSGNVRKYDKYRHYLDSVRSAVLSLLQKDLYEGKYSTV